MSKNLKKPSPAETQSANLQWSQLAFRISGKALATTEEALATLGAISVCLRDAADQPLLEPAPGEQPLWDSLTIEALFDTTVPLPKLLAQVQKNLPGLTAADIQCKTIHNQVWERAWMDRFQPMSFGNRLWIYPSHIEPKNRNTVNIRLDPGLAFGTGTHATTALCLQWLDKQDLSNKIVLDYGCGSGVLSIAAGKLGAKTVYAVDVDPQALQATEANAELNQVNNKITVCLPEHCPALQADIIVANIISQTLLNLKETFKPLLTKSGTLLMSGILTEQSDSIKAAYGKEFKLIREQNLDEWCCLEYQKQ